MPHDRPRRHGVIAGRTCGGIVAGHVRAAAGAEAAIGRYFANALRMLAFRRCGCGHMLLDEHEVREYRQRLERSTPD